MIYLLLLLLITLFALFTTKKKTFLILSFGSMFILAAIRKYNVGTDLELIYYPTFLTILNTPFQKLNQVGMEYGFSFFLKCISLFSNNIQLFIIISSALIYFSFARFFYKYSKHCAISTLAFYLSCNYFMSMNVIRQFLAISFLLFAFDFYKNKKYFRFIIFIALATSFHSSAIIFIMLPLINKMKINKSFFIKLCIIAIILFITIIPIINLFSNFMDLIGLGSNKLYNIYLNNTKYGAANLSLLNISDVLIGFLITTLGYYGYFISLGREKSNEKIKNNNSLILSSFYFLFTLLSLKISIVSRISLFFIPFLYVTLGDIFELQQNKINKLFCYYLIFGVFSVKWFYILENNANVLFGVDPYIFFWN